MRFSLMASRITETTACPVMPLNGPSATVSLSLNGATSGSGSFGVSTSGIARLTGSGGIGSAAGGASGTSGALIGCAAIAHAGADPVGVTVVGGGGVSRLAPRTRRGVVAEVARTLDAVTPEGRAALEQGFAGAPARVLVVTDCLGDVGSLVNAARAHVVGGGEVFVAHVVSRGELEPSAGVQIVVDPEDATVRRPLSDATRAVYRDAFDAWRQDTARSWRDAGVGYAEVRDDDPMDVAMAAHFHTQKVSPFREQPAP